MTNKEINAAIKSELTKAGYSVKDFRVSVKDSLYDGVIRVTIKNPLVRPSDIEKLLNHWESYELDQRNGEILQGGNTYVFVQYDLHAFDNIPEEYTERATAILGNMAHYDGREIATNERGACLHLLQDGTRYRLIECEPGTMAGQSTMFFYDASQLAEMLFRFCNNGTAAA